MLAWEVSSGRVEKPTGTLNSKAPPGKEVGAVPSPGKEGIKLLIARDGNGAVGELKMIPPRDPGDLFFRPSLNAAIIQHVCKSTAVAGLKAL